MRRVFNKNLSKASRGVSQVSNFGHASYIPCKVRFDFSNVRIEKLRTRAANVVLVWERRDKTIATEQQVVRSGNVSFSDGLHLECTLFKDPNSNVFQQKQAKFAVRVFSKEGKTIAKIHFNVAEYILVPSGSQDIKLSLSDGSILKGLVTTTLARSGRSGSASRGGSSAGFSAFTSGSGGLSQAGDFDDLTNDVPPEDEFNDLDFDDDMLGMIPTKKPTPAKATGGPPPAENPPKKNVADVSAPKVAPAPAPAPAPAAAGDPIPSTVAMSTASTSASGIPPTATPEVATVKAEQGTSVPQTQQPVSTLVPTATAASSPAASSRAAQISGRSAESVPRSRGSTSSTAAVAQPQPQAKADFRNVFISRENEQETESFVDFDAQPTNEKTEKFENHQPDTIKAVFEDAARLSNASKDALLRISSLREELKDLEDQLDVRKRAVADREDAGKEQIRTASSMAKEVEKLGMANRELELSSEKLNKELADLENENELAAAEEEKLVAKVEEYVNKNEDMRAQLDAVRRKIQRDAEEETLVNDLKAAKLQLAIKTMERDEAVMMVRTHRATLNNSG